MSLALRTLPPLMYGDDHAYGIPFTGSGPMLLAYGFWVRRFGGDPGIVGQALTINGDPMTVVGVLPASFDFPTVFAPGTRVDFIAGFPLTQETDQQGNTLALWVMPLVVLLIGAVGVAITVRNRSRKLAAAQQKETE